MPARAALMSLVGLAVLSQVADAHPGHGLESADPHSLTHYALHPDHLLQWFVAALVIALACRVVRRVRRPVPAYAKARK
jgi:hypothetical protein